MVRSRSATWAAVLAVLSTMCAAASLRWAGADGRAWADLVQGLNGNSVLLAVVNPWLGLAIVSREPRNRLGWVFVWTGLSRGGYLFAMYWAVSVFDGDSGPRELAGVAAWCGLVLLPVVLVLAPLLVLWFPNGSLPGRRWRWALVPSAVGGVALVVLGIASWSSRGPALLPDADSPAGSVGAVANACLVVVFLVCVIGLAAGLTSLLARYRSAAPMLRQQVKWFAYGVGAAVVLNVAGDLWAPGWGLNLAGSAVLYAAVVMAVYRYRLWDVDILINRTFVYGALTLLVVATYVVFSIGLALVLHGRTHGSAVVVAVATLAAAAVAAPAREALQRLVDRLFDRRTYDAVRRLEAYVHRLGGPDAPGHDDMVALVAECLHDPRLAVTFVLADGIEVDIDGSPVVGGSDDQGARVVELAGATRALIHHRVFAPAERHAIERVFRAAQPALEHASLQAELSIQLAEIKASRARLAEATDAERRRIERNLHDGAQQRLLALALRLRVGQRELNPAMGRAVAPLVDDAVLEVTRAVEDLRSLAAGLLPSALVSEGLMPAIRELAAQLPPGARVTEMPDHRHRDAVEAAAWFSAAEGVANVLKHAPGADVTLSARCNGSRFVLEVEDNGPGGASLDNGSGLRGLADRVEAAGGCLEVASVVDSGTRLRVVFGCG